MHIIVWACFWGNGKRYSLYIINWDFNLKKYKYSANFYLEVLQENLPYIY